MATRQLSTRQVVNLASDPASGTPGQIYYNTVDNTFKYYNGTSWVAISAGEGSSIFYQTTAPESPSVGDIWIDSDETVSTLNSNDFATKEYADTGISQAMMNSFMLAGM